MIKQKTKASVQEKREPSTANQKLVKPQPEKVVSQSPRSLVQAKQGGSTSTTNTNASKSGNVKGSGKDAKTGHQPKMRATISPAKNSEVEHQQELPDNGGTITRKLDFKSDLEIVTSAPENVQHSETGSMELAGGDVTAMAVENC
ncbi:unnamed protein product [Linum trigynum]|uniref:Uncharacterized protein n=1 Tax=Linum trigynum TaxID=586398 RepID=A0AAV2FGI4_9ROSI